MGFQSPPPPPIVGSGEIRQFMYDISDLNGVEMLYIYVHGDFFVAIERNPDIEWFSMQIDTPLSLERRLSVYPSLSDDDTTGYLEVFGGSVGARLRNADGSLLELIIRIPEGVEYHTHFIG
ncbi:MAG: hypothetical protein FWD35_01440 [Oscillospiraceae bacterium]|nr:hypothetical protein [Oscillospiraceae bacterium]